MRRERNKISGKEASLLKSQFFDTQKGSQWSSIASKILYSNKLSCVQSEKDKYPFIEFLEQFKVPKKEKEEKLDNEIRNVMNKQMTALTFQS